MRKLEDHETVALTTDRNILIQNKCHPSLKFQGVFSVSSVIETMSFENALSDI